MAYSDLSYSGSTGVINAAAYITELTSSGTSRYVNVKVTVWAIDYSGARDASYSVKCTQSGTNVSVDMYNGFTIDGSEVTIFDKSFYVSVAQGSSTANINLSFTASLLSPSSGTRSISGTISTLYLTAEPEEPEVTVTASTIDLAVTTVQMGSTLNISISRSDVGCSHTLKYRVLGTSSSYVEIAQDVLTTYAWTVPDLMSYCTDSLSLNVEIACRTYYGGSNIGETRTTVQVTAPPATKPSCNASASMGSALSITLERKSASYTHDLSYTMAGTSGAITSGAGASYSWDVPLELAKLIPLLTKGTCTVACVTFCGSMEVGRETVTVSLTVPDNEQTKPTGTMVLTPSGNLAEQFAGMFIRGRTGVTASFTGESEYSQVSRFELVVEGVTVTGNPATSAYLNSHGEVTVTGRIIDARGYARDITQTISVIAYDKPKVIPYTGESNVVAVRCDLDGTRNPKGQHLLIRAGRKYTALSTDGGQLNYCTLSYRYKTAAAEDYSDLYTLIAGEDLEADIIQMVVPNAVPDLKTGYTVQVQVSDTLGSYSVITVPVAAIAIPFHIGQGNNNVAVGKYCDYSRTNAFEVGFTTYFDTGIALREIFSGGSWSVGAELGSTVADAEVSAVSLYTLFIAVCNGEPVWMVKLGSGIYGNGIKMTLSGSALTLNTAGAAVTALYAVL